MSTTVLRLCLPGVVLLIAGCSWLPGRQFSHTFPADGGREALPVVLTDTSATVTGIDGVPDDFEPLIPDGVTTIVEDPNALVIHWTGGACDERVSITTEGSPGVTFVVTTTVRPVACEAIGIPRALLIRLSRPADPQFFAVRFEP